jgi:hypothetical protein
LLDAAQLLKHMLGLARWGLDTTSAWRLCCLWYRPVGEAGALHALELDRFAEGIGDDRVHFDSMMYQEGFTRLVTALQETNDHSAYIRYLATRYFAGVTL